MVTRFDGHVGSPGDVIDITLVLDTNIYADGDVLAVPQVISNATRDQGERCWLTGIFMLDEDDQGAALDLIFLDSNVSLGTINAAASISDANARKVIARVSFAAADFYDLGGCKVADLAFTPIQMKAGVGSRDLYIGAVSRGTGTYTASGLKLKLRLSWD